MKTANCKLQIGPACRWAALDGRRMGVTQVLREWDEPAAPWEGVPERRYMRLLLQSGGVLETYREGGGWFVGAVED